MYPNVKRGGVKPLNDPRNVIQIWK